MIKVYLIKSLNQLKWIFIPCFILVILSWINVLPLFAQEIIIQVSSVIAVVLGIPLAQAFRIDQLSLNLGSQYSREFALIIALFAALTNSLIIMFLKNWLLPKNTNESEKENIKITNNKNSIRETKIKRLKD